MEKIKPVGVTPQGLMVARQNANRVPVPGWLIAAEAERAAAEYLLGGYSATQAKNVCPDCKTVRATGSGACWC